MKINKNIKPVLFCLFIIIPVSIMAQQLAFPGAEGFGRYATGGRGGTVYHVTNLDDSGPGSFRDAVSQSNRIVVFDVGGVINISTRIVIFKNITVAGQTAPGDGITVYGNGIAFNDDSGNSIIRYIRFRMGAGGDSGKDAIGISAGQNYIFDHVSVSWGRDGTFDINGSTIDNITIQDCIISQGVNYDNHSTGGLMQSGQFSLIRTLFIDNKTRNPKGRGDHEYINNVVYNWGTNGYILGGSTTTTEILAQANIIGCYLISGPSVAGGAFTEGTTLFHAYVSDNYIDLDRDGTLNGSLATSDQYAGITIESTPYSHPGVGNLLSAEEAYYYVMANAGASLVRDEVDELLIEELASLGTKGKIITTEADNGITGNVGTVKGGIAPLDSDRDGMPDEWEFYYGLNPNSINDQNLDNDNDGYTNIEEYLNSTDPGSGTGILPAGYYFMQAGHSGKVLDVNNNMESGAYLVQNIMAKANEQVWYIDSIDNENYSIINKISGFALSVEGAATTDGARIIQNTYAGTDDQLWKISFLGKGQYAIYNKNSTKAVTISSGDTNIGASVIQEPFIDSSYQKIKMIPYGSIFNPPAVNIEIPAHGTLFMGGEDIYIQTDVTDYDGYILKVEFYDGTSKIGEDSVAPYRMIWQGAKSGAHNIIVVATDNDSLITTSAVTVTVIGSGEDGVIIQENKYGFCSVDGTVDSNNEGFTGSGFSNTTNAAAQGVNWQVNITQAGSCTVRFRYAAESGNRAGKILVNNADVIANLDFPATGSWTIWAETSTTLSLSTGNNIIRLEATTSSGLANIDYIEINGEGIELVNCGGFPAEGSVYMESYPGITGSLVDDLYYHASFPFTPGSVSVLHSLESPYNQYDNFGTRIRGFIVPEENGLYTFWISGYEQCQLWLSFDTIPANAVKIASVPGYTDIRQWNKYAVQQSEVLTLYKGQKHYFEILHKSGEGNDHVEVAWEGAGISQEIISSDYLLPWTDTTHKEGVIFTGIQKNKEVACAVYPNPVRDFIHVDLLQFSNDPLLISVYNINGALVYQYALNENKTSFNVSFLKRGLYLLKIDGHDISFTQKMIKE